MVNSTIHREPVQNMGEVIKAMRKYIFLPSEFLVRELILEFERKKQGSWAKSGRRRRFQSHLVGSTPAVPLTAVFQESGSRAPIQVCTGF